MRQGAGVCRGPESCACTLRTNTGAICRQLDEGGGGGGGSGGGGAPVAAAPDGVGVRGYSWVVVLGGGEGWCVCGGVWGVGGLAERTQSTLCFHKTCGM